MSRHPRADDDGTEQSFLQRWSRHKQRSEQGPDEVDRRTPEAPEPVADSGAQGPSCGEEAEEPVKTDADMPDVDAIDENTDMSGFFSPGVSQERRTQALRRLFQLSKFNVMDGLDDYAEDYRSFTPLGDIVTSDMRHLMNQARRRLGDAQGETDTALNEEPGAARDGALEEGEERRAEADPGVATEQSETHRGGADGDTESQV